MDKEIVDEIHRCISRKIDDLAKSSWTIDRLIKHKYGRVGCIVADVLMNIPIPEGKTRKDVYERIKELVDGSDYAIIENGEFGPFITFVDEEIARLMKEGVDKYLEARKNEKDKFFWGDGIYR